MLQMAVNEAAQVAAHRVCSDCYGDLKTTEVDIDADQATVECTTPGCTLRHTISRRTRTIRKQKNEQEYEAAAQVLPKGLIKMDAVNPRMGFAFPIVAQIRKGSAKGKMMKDGREIETVGKDLQDKFRVIFYPGNQGAEAVWLQHFKTLQPTVIHCMLPFMRVEACWEWYYEAYQAGRMIARADSEHYITLRDPGRDNCPYVVSESEPFVKYNPPDGIAYERNGVTKTLPMKRHGRLKIWIPDLERMVMIELRTTSFYDTINLDSQLMAVQAMGEALNHGNVAGIPLIIYRRLTNISWNNKGAPSRTDKWLINLEIDPEFVGQAIRRLRSLALGDSSQFASLLPGRPAEMQVDTPAPEEEAGSEDEDLDPAIVNQVVENDPETDRLTKARNVRTPNGRQLGELSEQQLGEIIRLIQGNRDNKRWTRGLNREEEQIMYDAAGICLTALVGTDEPTEVPVIEPATSEDWLEWAYLVADSEKQGIILPQADANQTHPEMVLMIKSARVVLKNLPGSSTGGN